MYLIAIGLSCFGIIHLVIGSFSEDRLPKTIYPLHYDLLLNAFDADCGNFTGELKMNVIVKETTNQIVFHSKDLTINKVQCRYGIKNHFVGKGEQYYIIMNDRLEKGTEFDVSIEFSGKVNSEKRGFYKHSIKKSSRTVWSAFLEPNYARTVFPCFDEPEFKATFALSIVRPQDLITLFNTPLLGTSDYKDSKSKSSKGNLVLDKYKKTPKMSTYLLSFVIGEFESKKKSTKYGKENLQIGVYGTKKQIDSDMGEYTLDVAEKLIQHYSKLFQVQLPLEKLDLVYIPFPTPKVTTFEGWGLITMLEDYLHIDPKLIDHLALKMTVWNLLAHDISLMWFGNMVTMKWWSDLWIQQGMSEFFAYTVPGEIPNSGMDLEMRLVRLIRSVAFPAEDSPNCKALIGRDIVKPDPTMYTKSMFLKGASMFRMLQSVIGGQKFKEGLKAYIQKYKLENAQSTDLWEILQSCNADDSVKVATIMESWTTQPGFPVITVTRQKNTFTFQQKPFTVDGNSKSSHTWRFPFQYRTSSKSKEVGKILIQEKSSSVTIDGNPPLWIIGNNDGSGYYRVNYDPDTWDAIEKQLLDDHTVFSTAERLCLIDDAFALAEAGELCYSQAFKLLKYLAKEEDFDVWTRASDILLELSDQVYITNTEAKETIKKFIQSLLTKHLEKLNLDENRSYSKRAFQNLIFSLGVRVNNTVAMEKALEKFECWVKKPSFENGDEVQLWPSIEAGVKSGSDENFNKAVNWLSQISTFGSLLPYAVQYLKLTENRNRISRILSTQFNKINSASKSRVLLTSPCLNVHWDIGWEFLKGKWIDLYKGYTNPDYEWLKALFYPALFKTCTQCVTTTQQLEKMKAFFAQRPSSPEIKTKTNIGVFKEEWAQAIKVAEKNVEWAKKNSDKISGALKEIAKCIK